MRSGSDARGGAFAPAASRAARAFRGEDCRPAGRGGQGSALSFLPGDTGSSRPVLNAAPLSLTLSKPLMAPVGGDRDSSSSSLPCGFYLEKMGAPVKALQVEWL